MLTHFTQLQAANPSPSLFFLRHDRIVISSVTVLQSLMMSHGLLFSHHTIITPSSLFLHKERPTEIKTAPFGPSGAMSASLAGFLPVEWWVDIRVRGASSSRSHRSRTRGGRE